MRRLIAIDAVLVGIVTGVASPGWARPISTNQPQIVAGTAVVDLKGGEVGAVVSAGPDFVTVKTDKYEVRLPRASFAPRSGSWAIPLTRIDLNSSVETSLTKLNELLKPGSAVTGSQGAFIGTIDKVDAEFVTLRLSGGKLVRLPRSGFAPGPTGLAIGLTAEQLEAQVPVGS